MSITTIFKAIVGLGASQPLLTFALCALATLAIGAAVCVHACSLHPSVSVLAAFVYFTLCSFVVALACLALPHLSAHQQRVRAANEA
jgi:hypothetical protein